MYLQIFFRNSLVNFLILYLYSLLSMESGSKREWKSVCICFPGSFSLFLFLSPCVLPCHPPWDGSGSRSCSKDESNVVKNSVHLWEPAWINCCDSPGVHHPLSLLLEAQGYLLAAFSADFFFFFYHRKLGAFTGAFWAVWQRLLFSLYVCCFPLILLYKRSHLCLKGRSVCKSVCNDWDEECEWAEKCRRHMFVAYSLSVLTSLSECMAQSSTGSWSPATECYITLVLLTLQIGSSRICFGAEDEVWLNMVIDIDI